MTVASSGAERIDDDILSNKVKYWIYQQWMRGNTPASIRKRVLKKRIEYNQCGSSY
jgi:hypothetical protein